MKEDLYMALLSLEGRMRGVARFMSAHDGAEFQQHSQELVNAADIVKEWASEVRRRGLDKSKVYRPKRRKRASSQKYGRSSVNHQKPESVGV